MAGGWFGGGVKARWAVVSMDVVAVVCAGALAVLSILWLYLLLNEPDTRRHFLEYAVPAAGFWAGVALIVLVVSL